MPADESAIGGGDGPGGMPTGRILVIDDDRNHADTMAEVLELAGHSVAVATTGSAGVRQLKTASFDLVLTDLKMRDIDGLEILEAAKQVQPDCEVILVTGHGDVQTAVRAMRAGAYDFIEKPTDLDDVRNKAHKALERAALVRRNRELERLVDERFGLEGIIGDSPPIRWVIEQVRTVAPTNMTVLITGEPGTGKELIAKAIHNNSNRANRRFVPVNGATLSGSLLQSELFGHKKGSFTGADKEREGKFEYASGGTLFLDELGEIPLDTQALLLRVLEEKTITRLGANQPIPVDVRLVCATNRDLDQDVKNGRFRLDLLSRIRQFPLQLPALRDRPSDISLLAQHFLLRSATELGKPVETFSSDALHELARQDFPSNVRDLQNLVQRCVLFARGSTITREEVRQQLEQTPYVKALEGVAPLAMAGDSLDLGQLRGITIDDAERALIRNTLKDCAGNRKQTAEALGISERTLYRKLNEMKEDAPD